MELLLIFEVKLEEQGLLMSTEFKRPVKAIFIIFIIKLNRVK